MTYTDEYLGKQNTKRNGKSRNNNHRSFTDPVDARAIKYSSTKYRARLNELARQDI